MSKRKTPLIVDTSTISDVKSRITKEAMKKLESWKTQLNLEQEQEQKQGTRRGLNSILKRASNKSKVSAEKAQKLADEKKARKLAQAGQTAHTKQK